jgi:hypothetical protein
MEPLKSERLPPVASQPVAPPKLASVEPPVHE